MVAAKVKYYIFLLLMMLSLAKVYAQESSENYWKYERTLKRLGSFSYLEFKLEKVVDGDVVQSSVFGSSMTDTLILTSYDNFIIDGTSVKGICYIWSPQKIRLLESITFMSGYHQFDSLYYFHRDGVSIRNISRNWKQNKKDFEVGEKFIFDYPFYLPDTMQTFYLKLLEGCPFEPCITK